MGLCINDVILNLIVEIDQGIMILYDWIGDSWVILFLYFKDFIFVCIIEFGVVV